MQKAKIFWPDSPFAFLLIFFFIAIMGGCLLEVLRQDKPGMIWIIFGPCAGILGFLRTHHVAAGEDYIEGPDALLHGKSGRMGLIHGMRLKIPFSQGEILPPPERSPGNIRIRDKSSGREISISRMFFRSTTLEQIRTELKFLKD